MLNVLELHCTTNGTQLVIINLFTSHLFLITHFRIQTHLLTSIYIVVQKKTGHFISSRFLQMWQFYQECSAWGGLLLYIFTVKSIVLMFTFSSLFLVINNMFDPSPSLLDHGCHPNINVFTTLFKMPIGILIISLPMFCFSLSIVSMLSWQNPSFK